MPKMTKFVLKGIVKECLVEILQEGLLQTTGGLNESYSRQPKKQQRKRKNIQTLDGGSYRRKGLDSISYNKEPESKHVNESFDRNIKKATENITSDPVLSSILMDTARTTLQEQNKAGNVAHHQPKDMASKIVEQSAPEDVFEGADKWAQLAFAPKLVNR